MATQQSKTYLWKGRDKSGKLRKNEIEAVNEQVVRAYLRKQGIYATSVTEKPKSVIEFKGLIRDKHIVSFSRQMATMLKAGMPIVKALSLIADGIHKPQRFRELVQQLHDDVETGNSFSESLSRHPTHFNELYVALVRAGEEAGALDETMEKIAQTKEKAEAVKKKVKKALIYPSIVVLVAIAVTTVLLVKVIPIFENFFAGFNKELPTLTQLVISVSHMARDWGWLIVLILIAVIMMTLALRRKSRRFRRRLNTIGLKLPLFGRVFRISAIARFSRTLSVLFESGVPLVQGLQATASATGSIIYEESCLSAAQDVSQGAQLSFSLQNSELYDPFVTQMVNVGEESGSLGAMLSNVADYYEEDLDFRISGLTTLLEPLIIGILAVLVGILVISMYMPIFTMGDAIG